MHELVHWKVARDYIKKHGKIPDNYLTITAEECEKLLDAIPEKEYTGVSKYAERNARDGRYDEIYAEYMVKKILKE